MGRRHRLAATALVAAAVLAACDSNTPPQTTTSTNPSRQAPPVKQPLDATPFQADACLSLTELQRNTLGLARGSNNISERECVLSSADQRIVVKVIFSDPLSSAGLERWYDMHSHDPWQYWEPTEVDGYPAVVFETSPADTKLACRIAVGVSDSSDFRVEYRFSALAKGDPGGKNPCVEVRAVASLVLSTIKVAK